MCMKETTQAAYTAHRRRRSDASAHPSTILKSLMHSARNGQPEQRAKRHTNQCAPWLGFSCPQVQALQAAVTQHPGLAAQHSVQAVQ
eukprot:3731540-Amphidinium_carterae.1